MPMAGEGSRFKNGGYTVPKPLIEADGLPLFVRALRSLDEIHCSKKYSFIVRQEHIQTHAIDKQIIALYPEARIFPVLQTTRGAVETCLMAEPAVDLSEAVLVLDCDLEFRSAGFNRLVEQSLSAEPESAGGGVLVSFDSDNPRFSYAVVDSANTVVKTAEKQVISNHAIAGAYFFAHAAAFLRSAKELTSRPTAQEFYVSLLYNLMIDRGEVVLLAKTDMYRSFGTPEELHAHA